MKLTVITVTWNSAATLADTMKSVAEQDCPNIEHIVIDGGSTDDTVKIAESFPHVSMIISEPDEGIYDAMNKGVAIATGDVIGILNSDDVFASKKIVSDIVNAFHDEEISAVYGNIEFFSGDNFSHVKRYWRSRPYYRDFFDEGHVPPHPSLFVRKRVYEEIGHYFPKFNISSDYEFMFRAFRKHKYKAFFLDKTIVKMRLGGESTGSVKNIILGNKEVYQAWKMNGESPPLKFYLYRPWHKVIQLLRRS